MTIFPSRKWFRSSANESTDFNELLGAARSWVGSETRSDFAFWVLSTQLCSLCRRHILTTYVCNNQEAQRWKHSLNLCQITCLEKKSWGKQEVYQTNDTLRNALFFNYKWLRIAADASILAQGSWPENCCFWERDAEGSAFKCSSWCWCCLSKAQNHAGCIVVQALHASVACTHVFHCASSLCHNDVLSSLWHLHTTVLLLLLLSLSYSWAPCAHFWDAGIFLETPFHLSFCLWCLFSSRIYFHSSIWAVLINDAMNSGHQDALHGFYGGRILPGKNQRLLMESQHRSCWRWSDLHTHQSCYRHQKEWFPLLPLAAQTRFCL